MCKIRKVYLAVLVVMVMILSLSSCGSRSGYTDEATSKNDSPTSQSSNENFENWGSSDTDSDFSLESPGEANFDDVGLAGSQVPAETVDPVTGDEVFVYTEEDEVPRIPEPNLSTNSGTGSDTQVSVPGPVLENSGAPSPAPHDVPVDTPTLSNPPVSVVEPNRPVEPVIPPTSEEVKIPNTGIFLEDD